MPIKAAEYYGRCQACDRLQKLPENGLAKHGYQVADRGNGGYFSGTCKGSGHQAYEESCDWIKNYLIPEAKKEEARLVEFCAKVKATDPTVDLKGYHSCYNRFGSFWVKVKILGAPDHKYPCLEMPADDYNSVKIRPASSYTWLPSFSDVSASSLVALALAMNEYYAKHLEANDIRRIRSYIKWQEGRVADWKLRPLPPVDKVKELRKQLNKEFEKRESEFIAA